MQKIVTCPKCTRQYDAGTWRDGSRFRCRCGEALVARPGTRRVESPVRCQSCGAGDQGHREHCESCQASLAPKRIAASPTSQVCPACQGGQCLHSRRLGDVEVWECDHCAGLWLSTRTFEHLAELAGSEALRHEIDSTPLHVLPAADDDRQAARPRYRPCPLCGSLMNRNNYGTKSGVILDTCRQHGAWFDADELERILSWIRSGGLAKANQQRAVEAHEAMAQWERGKVRAYRADCEINQHFPWIPYGLAPLFTRLFFYF